MVAQRSDVLVVGGGPAGSTCAWKLRSAGLDVLLIDKMDFPRDKPCAGWITPAVVQSLEITASEYGRDHVWQPISGFRCGVIGGKQVELNYGQPISFGIRRCQFDTYLLRRSGARCQLGERVETISRKGNVWSLNGKYEAPMLVGSGGTFCPVARMLGVQRNQAAVVVAQETEFEIPANEARQVSVKPEIPELFFCEDLRGYGWCFRKNNFLNIGLGRVGEKNLSRHIRDFCTFLKLQNRVRCDIPSQFRGHAYRLFEDGEVQPFDNGVLLIGDSVGLAYAQSGEGIRPAVESAFMAADAITKAENNYSKQRLELYGTRLRERFGKSHVGLLMNKLPVAWLMQSAAGLMSSRLLSSRWFSRNVVMDRWFLRTNQTPLSI